MKPDNDTLLKTLRAGGLIQEHTAAKANQLPHIDELRAQVNADDVEWLIRLTANGRPSLRHLAISLTQNVRGDKRIRTLIRNLWDNETDFRMRYAVMWRLLDDPKLEPSCHLEAYRFVQEHWETFQQEILKYKGEDAVPELETLMRRTRERLASPTFPESKAWAYLCGVTGLCNDSEVAHLLAQYVDSKASIVSQVAKDLLGRLQA